MVFNISGKCDPVIIKSSVASGYIDDACIKSLGKFIQDNQSIKRSILGDNKILIKGWRDYQDI